MLTQHGNLIFFSGLADAVIQAAGSAASQMPPSQALRHIPAGRDPGHAGGTVSLSRPGNASALNAVRN